ncbi:MAG: hypothetical protein ACI843_001143 [Psychrobacter glaciei]
MTQLVKLSFSLATLIGIAFNFEALLNAGYVNWLGWLLTYLFCFVFFYFYLFKNNPKTIDDLNIQNGTVSPDHLEALYKHAMIVERNAQKANIVFSQQLLYVKKVINQARKINPDDDFYRNHEILVKQLNSLEHHLEHLLGEMKKNVKLGEKLQQSVANIDPEIGIL